MDPILAFGQIIVSIALIVAILLQARGTGLSSTFGGDSAVYRSRRGVERRLWQFTDRAADPVRHLLARVLRVRARLIRSTAAPTARNPPSRSPMTRHDSIVVGTLVVLLALVAGLVGLPALTATASASATASPGRPRRGASRTAKASSATRSSISPLTARSQADRDLVALIFSGLVRNGPSGTHRARPRGHLVGRCDGQDLDVPPARRRDLAGRHAGHRRGRRVHDQDPAGPGLHGPGGRLVERGGRPRRRRADGHVHPRRRRSAASSRRPPSRSPRPTCWPTSRSMRWRTIRSGPSPSGRVRSRSPTSPTRRRRLVPVTPTVDGEPEASPGASGDSLATPGPTRPARSSGAVPLGHRVHVLRRRRPP